MPPHVSLVRFAYAAAGAAMLVTASAAHADSVRLLKPVFVAPHSRAQVARAGRRQPGAAPELANRLSLLATPGMRGASPPARADRLALPARGPGSLAQVGGDVIVRVRASSAGDAVVRGLRHAGARVLDADAALGFVTVAVAPNELDALAAVPGVEAIMPQLRPLTAGAGVAECHGAATSEADQQLRAAEARQAFGVSGAGVKVGVISDSFDRSANAVTHAAGDVSSGDLPGPGNPCGHATGVDVRGDAAGTDEGRAMAQVVHDLAPGAQLAFAPATPESAWGDRIADLAAAGADVIVDDISFLDEPFFQDGPLAVAADQAAAGGIPYYSSAANNNLIVNAQNRASWEAPSFRATTCPNLPDAEQACMNFGTAAAPSNAQPFLVAAGGTLTFDFQWAEPWFGIGTDLDVFLLDGNGNTVAKSDEDNVRQGLPFEILSVTNNSAQAQVARLVIGRFSGASPRLKWNLVQPSGNVAGVPVVANAADVTGPTIFGHNGGEGVMTVAAVPFNDDSQIEPFSSRGPVTHYFGPVTSTTPAPPLAAPKTLAKPDLAATDGAATTFFAEDVGGGTFRFFGTSEAAPHAAAIAALEIEAAPSASVAQIVSAQKSTATPVGAFGATAGGSGLVNAVGAVGAIRQAAPTPTPTPTATPTPTPTPVGSPAAAQPPAATTAPTTTTAPPAVTLAVHGRTLSLRVGGAFSRAVVTIKKGRRTVVRASGRLRAGKLTLRLRRALKHGRYTATIVLTDAHGAKQTVRKSLRA